MWNWSHWKTTFLGVATAGILYIVGMSPGGSFIVGGAFAIFMQWVIKEINFVRKAHGSQIAQLENDIEKLKKKIR